jgi:glycosyltransferase involved in cell wall biosynthesis
MASSIPRLTVAICTRNRAGFLERALQSVVPQLTPLDELIIIDNASTDNTAQVAARFAKADNRIQIFREEQLGLSAARNAAHRLGRAEYVLFLDDDAIVKPGWIEAYANFIQRHKGERIGCVGGACVPDYEAPPPAWHNPKPDSYDLGEKEFAIASNQRTPGGGNCAYNTAAIFAVGGFCNDLKRAEDTDMHHRLHRAGYSVWWLPEAPIYHFMSKQRLQFWRMAKAAFVEGRAYARVRIRQKEGDSAMKRELYRAGRVAISIPYALWYLLAAICTWPLRRGKLATRSFQRALRVAGIGWQMAADLARFKFSYS